MNVEGKIVVITGGADGIGLSCAEEVLLHGAKYVIILDLKNSLEGKAFLDFKQRNERKVRPIICDVTKTEDVERAFDNITMHEETFDILINSAGIADDAKWDRMIDINFTGLVRITLKAIDTIGKHRGGNGGTIVNIASIAGLTPFEGLPVYCATKFAVAAFTRCLQSAFETTGVRMLVMCPGITRTALNINLTRDKTLDFVDHHKKVEVLNSIPTQTPAHVGCEMIKLINNGENGTFFVVELGKPGYTVDFPVLDDIQKRYSK